MGIFKTGFTGYAQELQDTKKEASYLNKFFIKTGEMKEVIILDDTGFRFYLYSIMTPRGAAQLKSIDIVCNTENPSECVLSRMGFTPTLVTVMTVKNLTGYFKSNGEKAGVGERQLLILKPTSAKLLEATRATVLTAKAEDVWNNQKQLCAERGYKSLEEVKQAILNKGNILKNSKVTIGRTDSKAPSTGNYFMFNRWVKQEELSNADVPFVYEDLFKVKTDKEIVDDVLKFYHENQMQITFNIPSVGAGASLSTNTSPSVSAQVQPKAQELNFVPQGAVAPTFSEDDIPF